MTTNYTIRLAAVDLEPGHLIWVRVGANYMAKVVESVTTSVLDPAFVTVEFEDGTTLLTRNFTRYVLIEG